MTHPFSRREPRFDWEAPAAPLGTSGAGQGDPSLYDGPPPVAIKRYGQDTQPLAMLRARGQHPPAFPAAVLPMPQARAVMTVYPPAPGTPAPTPQALEVVRYLRAKVAILRGRGQLSRISDEKLAMLPADRIANKRTTARLIVDEAAELLRCGGPS